MRSLKKSIYDIYLPIAAVICIKAASNPIPSPEILTKMILKILAIIVFYDNKLWYSTPERTDLISGIPEPIAYLDILSQINTAINPHIIFINKKYLKSSLKYLILILNRYNDTFVIKSANIDTIVVNKPINIYILYLLNIKNHLIFSFILKYYNKSLFK